jgi:hypothetical protein
MRTGGRYNPEWVDRLHRQVVRHWPVGRALRFICLSDAKWTAPYSIVPLIHNWPGWWSKIEMFNPVGFCKGHSLYLDLDTIIEGPMLQLAMRGMNWREGGFRAMKDPNTGGLQSAVMRWTGQWQTDVGSNIYVEFSKDPKRAMAAYEGAGDQAFIQDMIEAHGRNWGTFELSEVASYKAHILTGKAPTERCAIQFHGEPKMDSLPKDSIYFQRWIDAA